MSLVFDGPVTPDDLTVFVQEVPLPNLIWLNNVLPDRYILSNRVDVGKLTKKGRTARFRAYDGPVHRAKRNSAQLTTVELPPLSDELGVGEYERLQMEFARVGGTRENALATAIYDDATNLTENVQRRMELARGDVLADGKFTLAGEGGLFIEADYDVPGGNFVNSSVTWADHDHSDPILDYVGWIRAYKQLNGYNPGGQIMPLDTLLDLQQSKALKAQFASIAATVGDMGILSQEQVNVALQRYGLPPIIQVYDSQVDVDDVSTRVLPLSKVIFVPPDPGTNLGYTAWGISATALELVNSGKTDLTFEEAAGIVGVVTKDSGVPYQQHTFVDAVGMPVIENPNALMVASVDVGEESSSSSSS